MQRDAVAREQQLLERVGAPDACAHERWKRLELVSARRSRLVIGVAKEDGDQTGTGMGMGWDGMGWDGRGKIEQECFFGWRECNVT